MLMFFLKGLNNLETVAVLKSSISVLTLKKPPIHFVELYKLVNR